jgi:hypothetical protein
MARSLFAWQVFLPLVPGNRLRELLHRTILGAPAGATYEQKRALFHDVAALLLPAAGAFRLGNWDYTNDDAEAEAEHERWCQGTIADARARSAAPPAGGGAPEPRYFFATLLLLLRRGSAADLSLERATTLPAEALWHRATFAGLLGALPALDFAGVKSDALFVCPGLDHHGLTEAEVHAEKYGYLHPIL